MGLLGQREGMVKRILVLSDGQPTAGVRDVDGFNRVAENCRRMGASVTTIGVDISYDEKIMSALARSSNGHHFFVADAAGLPPIFDKEMESLTKTVANRAELTVDLAPGVFADHVFDRSVTNNGDQIVVPLGTFAALDHKTLLVRLRVPRSGVGERPVAAVRLRYDDLAESKAGNCEGKLATRLTDDTSTLVPLDAVVSARLSGAETARTLETANALFRAGKADEARGLLLQEQARQRVARKAANKWAPADKAEKIEATFEANEGRLSGAGSGFAPPASGARPAPAADAKGQATIRQNQQDAQMATE
jgi:Ca-activated chloride channel family protein